MRNNTVVSSVNLDFLFFIVHLSYICVVIGITTNESSCRCWLNLTAYPDD